MERCEHYTLNCEQEKMGCEGCAYYKPETKTDRTYCTKMNCATKEECGRHIFHHQIIDGKVYSFIAECEEYQG